MFFLYRHVDFAYFADMAAISRTAVFFQARKAWAACCLVWLLAACAREEQPAPTRPAAQHIDLAYGSDPQQRMDLYLPEGRDSGRTPLLVMIHGGAWISGDKGDFRGLADSLRRLLPGLAIANLNYRLAAVGRNLFPTQETDIRAAMDFLGRQAAAYHISRRCIFLGASAGGQLALLQAYKYPAPHALAVISLFGPTDMAAFYAKSAVPEVQQWLPLLMQGTPEQNPALYASSSPLHYVSSASCPTLIFHGGADPLVPPAQSLRLRDTLQTLGVPVRLQVYPGAGHGWSGDTLADTFDQVLAFLEPYSH